MARGTTATPYIFVEFNNIIKFMQDTLLPLASLVGGYPYRYKMTSTQWEIKGRPLLLDSNAGGPRLSA